MDRTTQLILLAALAATLALQIWATMSLLQAKSSYSRTQVVSQLVIIWLVPFLGAVLCLAFATLTGAPEHSREKNFLDGADASGVQSWSGPSFDGGGEGGGDHIP